MDVTLQAAPVMRSRLLAIVKTEDPFDLVVQFVGDLDCAAPAAVGAALVFDSLEVNSERLVELGDGPSENYGPPGGTFLHHGKAVRAGKFLHLLDVGRIGAELLREILPLHVLMPAVSAVKVLESIA
jgi:hypothetical protein